MQIGLSEINNFDRTEDLEEAYYNSTSLAARTGIIGHLYNEKQGHHSLEKYPLEWQLAFAIRVAQENLIEAIRRSGKASEILISNTNPGQEPDTKIPNLQAKANLNFTSGQLSRTAKRCMMYVMSWYCLMKGGSYLRVSTLLADKAADTVVSLLGESDVRHHIFFRKKKARRFLGKFLECYARQHSKGNKANLCLDAIINYEYPELLRIYRKSMVEERCRAYYKRLIKERPRARLSDVLEKSPTGDFHGKSVAGYLVDYMAKNGRFDNLVK